MISFSPEFNDAAKQPEKTIRLRVFNYGEDKTDDPENIVEIWNEDLISGSIDSAGNFLGAGSRMATLSVFNDQSLLLGNVLRLDFEIKGADGTWETIVLGFFNIFQVEHNLESNISRVTLYDPVMTLSVTPYTLEDALFPMTVQQLAETVAGLMDVTLDVGFTSLPNYDYTITENLWKTIQNTNFRDVLQQIAETTGTTAVVSNNTLLFRQFNGSLTTLNEENLIKFRMGQKWGNANSLVLSRMPQNDNILLQDETDIEANGLYEISIINNQIVDDDRTTLIEPLYDSLITDTPFIKFYDSELRTEGYGYFEVGDLITANLSGVDYPVFINEHHLQVGTDGFSETIKSIIPTNPAVNKTTAGGILRTLWNTEIKVDRQNNEITSIVSRQDEFETATNDNFTLIQQDIENIQISVQDGGGVNQIKNSVGYSTDIGDLVGWEYDGSVVVESQNDTGSLVAGALSGNRIDFTTDAGSITQRVPVKPNSTLNLTFYAKKDTQGVATVSLHNDNDTFSIQLDDNTPYDWQRFVINDVIPTSSYLDITIEIDSDVDLFSITDLMLAKGAVPIAWQQAVGEVANATTTFDATGIKVRSNVYEGAYTQITPLEFAGYDSNGQRAFAVNNDTTEVNNLEIDGNVETASHSIIILDSGPNAGINFVIRG